MLHIEVEFVVQEDSGNWCLLPWGSGSTGGPIGHSLIPASGKRRRICWKIVNVSRIRFFSVAHNQMVNHTSVLLLIVFNINATVKARIGNQ